MQKASVNRSPGAPGPGQASAHAGGRLVFLLALATSVGYMCRVDIAVVAPRLMAELNLSQLQMGKVFSAFLLGYTRGARTGGPARRPGGGALVAVGPASANGE